MLILLLLIYIAGYIAAFYLWTVFAKTVVHKEPKIDKHDLVMCFILSLSSWLSFVLAFFSLWKMKEIINLINNLPPKIKP